jgi:hypothetical protein
MDRLVTEVDNNRHLLSKGFGIDLPIDSDHLHDLYLYKYPTEESLSLYPPSIVARNSSLRFLLGNDCQVIGSINNNSKLTGLFTSGTDNILKYARIYRETGKLVVIDNIGSSVAEFIAGPGFQDIGSDLIEYMKPYVVALSLLPNSLIKSGYNGDTMTLDEDYLLGAILGSNVNGTISYLRETSNTLPIFLLCFGTTEFLRQILTEADGIDDFPLVLEIMAYVPNAIFYELYNDIIKSCNGNNYVAAKSFHLCEMVKLWLLSGTVTEEELNITRDYEYEEFQPTEIMYKYYKETLRK